MQRRLLLGGRRRTRRLAFSVRFPGSLGGFSKKKLFFLTEKGGNERIFSILLVFGLLLFGFCWFLLELFGLF